MLVELRIEPNLASEQTPWIQTLGAPAAEAFRSAESFPRTAPHSDGVAQSIIINSNNGCTPPQYSCLKIHRKESGMLFVPVSATVRQQDWWISTFSLLSLMIEKETKPLGVVLAQNPRLGASRIQLWDDTMVKVVSSPKLLAPFHRWWVVCTPWVSGTVSACLQGQYQLQNSLGLE